MIPQPEPPKGTDCLVWFFPAYAAGILAAPFFHPISTCLALLLMLSLFLFCIFFRDLRIYFLIFLLAFFGFAYYHWSMAAPTRPNHVSNFSDSQRTIEGYVNHLIPRPSGALLNLEASLLVSRDGVFPLAGKVLLFIDTGCPDVKPGDRVRVVTQLRKPQLYGVPGEFHFPRHLARNRIYVTGTVTSANWVVKLGGKNRFDLKDAVEGFRQSIRSFIEKTTAPDTAPFLRALAIGDRGGLTPEERDLLARSGVAHLFAISGLHMGIIFCFFYILLKYFYLRSKFLLLLAPPKRFLPLFIVPLLLFYLFLAGGGPPTQRAFLALALGSLIVGLGIYVSPLRIVLSVAFFLILSDPLTLFSPSYQLSFAAVFAILYFAPKWQGRLSRFPGILRYTGNLFFITVTATLATLPFILFHFHVFAPTGLLLNMICVPLVTFIALPCTLAGVGLFSFAPLLGEVFFKASAFSLDWTLAIIRHLTPSASSGFAMYYPTPLELTLPVLLITVLLVRKKLTSKTLAWLVPALALTGLFLFPPSSSDNAFMLTALNVGHGDALVVKKNAKTYLVDGGGSYSDNFDVGARLLAPALASMGIRNIDAVILTHAHPDHYKGLAYIVAHFQVKEFWSAITPDNLPEMIRKPLMEKKLPLRCFPEGWTTVEEGPEGSMNIFVPKQNLTVVNDRSLVLHLKEGMNSILLTGDLEEAGVTGLLEASAPLQASLLKLPHHGSPRSLPARLIAFFEPNTVFATTSRNISCQSLGTDCKDDLKIHTYTSTEGGPAGSMRFIAKNDGWEVRYWERGLFR